ncbi:aminodeoxychorismate synthase component I [Actinosynnema sp. NPDC020468]|uniref:aminodeoxychorismate synthase component I n=1 Tax=Actinosynnema sp. NPDC020468 TaxID=3154488 RepID=UPI00340532D2
MRTLLIDNYDSFTYNLFHLLGEVNGEPPAVVSNDDRFDLADLRHFDNVVISPGPGRPERTADFGICADVIAAGDLPLLGVCLGHQGLCLLAGGEVGPAPEVRHGRLSPVLHDGRELFAGLPSPFHAVRYHSLAVTRVPDEVEVTARTPDGVVMAVRHRTRPQWGVQFHPESILTEHSRELLANFRELTRRHAPRRVARTAKPAPARPAAPAAPPRTRRAEVLVRRVDVTLDARRVYQELYRDGVNPFWLDSSSTAGPDGRISVLGDASGPLARTAQADVRRGVVEVESRHGTELVAGSFLTWLDRDLRSFDVRVPALPFGFALGWVGYLGYELKAECGGRRAHRAGTPDATMVFADRAVVVDHHAGCLYLLALAEDPAGAPAWLEATRERLEALARVPEADLPPPRPVRLSGRLRARHGKREYLRLVERAQREIAAGESYEVCLTNAVTGWGEVDPFEAYRFLREHNPVPFGALLRFGRLAVLSTSPERFVSVGRDGTAEAKPIKGTRPRGPTPEEDERLRRDLASSEKDRAENLMILDLLRNDLGRHARLGSVHVPKAFDVESYATVHQLVSTVRARLAPGVSAVRGVQAAFPGGSMTGAPKVRTMQIVDELEAGPRGVYSGALGYFSLCGAADLSIVIRTLVVDGRRVEFGVGGAVIALSDPEEEFAETVVKATPMLRLFGQAFPEGGEDPATLTGA